MKKKQILGESATLSRWEIDHELCKRLRPAPLTHLGLFAVVLLGTEFRHDHPWMLAIAGFVILASNALRVPLVVKESRFFPGRSSRWRNSFLALLLASTAGWTLLASVSILSYGTSSNSCILTLLMTAGIAAGGTASLSADARFARIFLAALFGPPSLLLLQYHGGNFGLGVSFVGFMAFLWAQAGIQAKGFLASKENERQCRAAEAALRIASRRAERDRRFSENIASLIPEDVYIYDLGKREAVYRNHEGYVALGYNEAEIKSGNESFLSRVIHPEDLPRVFRELEDLKHRKDGEISETVARARHKDGSYRWIRSRRVIFKRDEDGVPTHIIGINQDITEQKLREKAMLSENTALAESQRALKQDSSRLRATMDAAFELIPSIVWTAQPDGAPDYYNRFWLEYTGLGVEGAQALGWTTILHPDDVESCLERWKRSVDTGEAFETEYRFKRASDAQYRWHLGRALPVRGPSGEIVKWIGTCTDIHDQKLAEAASHQAASAVEASRLKSAFLASVSHELRTPICGITGMAELVAGTRLDTDQKNYVAAIRDSADHLLRIVNDILDFTRVEAGRLELSRDEFSIDAVIAEVRRQADASARKKGLVFKSGVETDVATALMGDSARVRQVLASLVDNAIKFTSSGAVTISVRKREGGGVRVEVVDSGIGISEEASKRLFEPLTQGDSSMSRRFGGAGLGLSLSKQLVQLMGGEIGVSSVEGKGSTFWFTVPQEERGEKGEKAGTVGAVRPRQHESKEALPDASSVRILLAEDNAVNQVVAVKLLEKSGYRARVVTNGREAIDALSASEFDLILMDCQMPEMDGYEATRLIRQGQALGQADIPIIALTANALKGDRELCLAAGMSDYVSKPIKPAELIAAIERAIRERKSGESLGPVSKAG